MRFLHKIMITAAAGGSLVVAALPTQAQDWPTNPVRIVVPYAPGGTADALGRIIAEQLSKNFKQQFFVENKPGAAGVLGSTQVARAAPDGYTLVVSGSGSHVIAPAVNPNAAFDTLRDFTHIAFLGGPPAVLVVNPTVKANTLKEFEDLIRKSATKISYGSPGAGTHGHLIAEAFLQRAGLKMEHIAYKGASAAQTDVIGGHVPAAFNTLSTAAAHIRSGSVKALAVTSPARLKGFPEVPTFAELGYPNLVATTWFSLSGPAGIPKDIVDKLNKEVVRSLALPQVRERLDRDEIVSEHLSPDEFTKFVADEIAKWKPIAKSVGVQPE